MTALNPFVLGWQEFWLRIVVIAYLVAVIILLLSVMVKLALLVWDAGRWLARAADRRGQEPAQGPSAHPEQGSDPCPLCALLDGGEGPGGGPSRLSAEEKAAGFAEVMRRIGQLAPEERASMIADTELMLAGPDTLLERIARDVVRPSARADACDEKVQKS